MSILIRPAGNALDARTRMIRAGAVAQKVAFEQAGTYESEAYSQWYICGCRWTQNDYQDAAFRSRYVLKKFEERALQILGFLGRLTLVKLWAKLRQQVYGVPVLRITSFACGPGTDAVSLVVFLKGI
jgi:hypothetical protein